MNRRFVAMFALFAAATLASPAFAQSAGPGLANEITVSSMYQQADWVVKTVMVVLALASVATLSIWIAKTVEIITGRRQIAESLKLLADAQNLATVSELPDRAADDMLRLTREELKKTSVVARSNYAEGAKERVAAMIQRVEAGRLRKLSRGASIVGSIGASAPFIGLFGTVWGIMNSFIGIAQAQTTNLAVVAPGIAEALLTTAIGLVAAIPAVLVYNAIVRAISGYRLRLTDAATQIMCLLSRDLDSGNVDATIAVKQHVMTETVEHRRVEVVHGV